MKNPSIQTNSKKEFNPNDAILVFATIIFICLTVIFIFIVKDMFTLEHFLSMNEPLRMGVLSVSSLIGILVVGVILTFVTPSKYIDDTNKTFQNYSLGKLVSFLLLGAIFEELLLRAIIQNVLLLLTNNEWSAIFIATALFVAIHTHYYKKPIMLLGITIPGLIFGWVYFETGNIIVPIVVHFLANLVMTLLFKYNLLKLKE
ncbi:CPBP family intramembrane glutamic endopeptidase [Bacillus sp. AK128]